MILRDEFLGHRGIFNARADPACDVLREFGVRGLVYEYLTKVAEPDPKPGFTVQPVPQGPPFFRRHFVEATPIGFVFKAPRRTRAGREDLLIARSNVGHFRVCDGSVVKRCTPIRPPLEYREFADLVRDLPDDLYSRRTRADHRDFLAAQIDRFMRPIVGVE